MNGIEFSIAPIIDVEGVLILFRELCSISKADARGGSRADIDNRRQTVGIVIGPFS